MKHSLLQKKRLRIALTVFFLALFTPSAVLVYQVFKEFEWEVFHQHRLLAEKVTKDINQTFLSFIRDEEQRSFADYGFWILEGDQENPRFQRSELSEAHPLNDAQGVIGYFQIDADGRFSTPLLPSLPNNLLAGNPPPLSSQELASRVVQQNTLYHILSDNQLVDIVQAEQSTDVNVETSLPVYRDRAQDSFEEVARQSYEYAKESLEGLATLSELNLDDRYEQQIQQQAPAVFLEKDYSEKNQPKKSQSEKLKKAVSSKESLEKSSPVKSTPVKSTPVKSGLVKKDLAKKGLVKKPTMDIRQARKETGAVVNVLQNPSPLSVEEADSQPVVDIELFVREVNPFEFSILESGHWVLYRQVWHDQQRTIQGVLLDPKPFLAQIVKGNWSNSALAAVSDVVVAYEDIVLAHYSANDSKVQHPSATLLYQQALSIPFAALNVVYSVQHLPMGPGGKLVLVLALVMAFVLIGGLWWMYLVGMRQILLAQQQQDFVSAVSHELKTPLTSIRMYGEMLKAGWASEEQKQVYYQYIFDESERLSRLIANVLQLARLSKNHLEVDLSAISVAQMMNTVESRVSTQMDSAGFEWSIESFKGCDQCYLQIDLDYFVQIIINLVDNALKFSKQAERKEVVIKASLTEHDVQFTVRDFGPGIEPKQMNKIFELFYRTQDELTRETVGTGIGLALVMELTKSMRGKIEVINSSPGATFQLSFPIWTSSS